MSRHSIERNISFDDQRQKYYVTLHFGVDPETGKVVRQTRTFDTRKEARAALRKHEAQRDAGLQVVPRNTTFGQWLSHWLETVAPLNRAVTTVYSYRNIIQRHILPALGDIPLQALTPQHLQRYYAMLVQEKQLSGNTARKHHDLINLVLKQAVNQDLIFRNPAERVEPPKHRPPTIHFYAEEDLQRLFQAAEGTRLEVLIKLAGYLGLRREEILGLKWDCVCFETRTLEIRSVRTAAGKFVVTKEPKTESSRRVLHIPDDLADTLHREQDRQAYYREQLGNAYHDTGYVFAHEDGRPFRPNHVSDLFVAFIRKNQLPPLTLHGLRHSFASIANAKGIPMYDIGKALGHSTPATTSKIYTHLLDPTHKDLLEKLWET